MALESLPVEVQEMIFDLCADETIISLSRVSKLLRLIAIRVGRRHIITDITAFEAELQPRAINILEQENRELELFIRYPELPEDDEFEMFSLLDSEDEWDDFLTAWDSHEVEKRHIERKWLRTVKNSCDQLVKLLPQLSRLRLISLEAEPKPLHVTSIPVFTTRTLLHVIAFRCNSLVNLRLDLRPDSSYRHPFEYDENYNLVVTERSPEPCNLCHFIAAKIPTLQHLYLGLPTMCSHVLRLPEQAREENNNNGTNTGLTGLKLKSLTLNLANHTARPHNLLEWTYPQPCQYWQNLTRKQTSGWEQELFIEQIRRELQNIMRHAPGLRAKIVREPNCVREMFFDDDWNEALDMPEGVQLYAVEDMLVQKRYLVENGKWDQPAGKAWDMRQDSSSRLYFEEEGWHARERKAGEAPLALGLGLPLWLGVKNLF